MYIIDCRSDARVGLRSARGSALDPRRDRTPLGEDGRVPLPWSDDWAGRIEEAWIDSDALKDNRPGDPHVRPVWVYLPPGYDAEPGRRYPSVYQIQGMTGQIDMW